MDESTRMPNPPWIKNAGRAPRRQLSLELILEAAERLSEHEGWDSVTMRRIAQEIGTGPASLYAHVDSKADLDQLLYDRALEAVPLPEPDPRRWREQLVDLGVDMARAMAARPGTARVALDTPIPATPRALQIIDRVFAVLAAGEVPPDLAVAWADVYALQVTAAAYELSPTGPPGAESERLRVQSARIGEYLAVLPESALPHLRAVLPRFGPDADPFAPLRSALEMLVAGMAARMEARPDRERTGRRDR